MAITAGTRLGSYEIVPALGAGGMGEVYRARDTKLGREVAVKILLAEFALDLERLARFGREAHVLASLNHPHIAAIYGFEQSSPSAGSGPAVQFLILELVEGADLSQRIARGAIPLEEALPIAKQIAEALEAAHEQGIIHRDLKPANIKVRDDGAVKVLDFGLAKALEPASVLRASAGHAHGEAQGVAFSQSPTVTTPAMMTGVGTILGTAAYMSPEQAKGRPADKRSDVWAFGCVLYEMLTGRRAFEGEDVSDTLAAVLRGEPDWTALPSDVPAPMRTLIARCLQKDRRQRIAEISTAQCVLHEAGGLAVTPGPQDAASIRTHVEAAVSAARREVTRTWCRRLAVVSATLLVLGAAVAGAAVWFATRPAAPQVSRVTIATTGTAGLTIGGVERDLMRLALDRTRTIAPLLQTKFDERNGTVSPDGHWLAYESDSSGQPEIYVRPFPNASDGLWQVSTMGGTRALFARSGRELFFIGPDGALMRVPVDARGTTWSAGTPVRLLDGRYVTGGNAGRSYDVSPDGQRFLMIKAAGTDATATPPSLVVVLHFDAELTRLVPTAR